MMDNLFNNNLLRSSLTIGHYLNQFVDRGVLYVFGLVGISRALNNMSYTSLAITNLQTSEGDTEAIKEDIRAQHTQTEITTATKLGVALVALVVGVNLVFSIINLVTIILYAIIFAAGLFITDGIDGKEYDDDYNR